MSAITYRSLVALSNSGQTVDTASAAFVIPAGAAVGETVLVTMAKNTTTTTVTTVPTGFTAVDTPTGLATAPGPIAAWQYYKVLETGEPGTTVTWVFPTAGRLVGIMEVFDHLDVRITNIFSSNTVAATLTPTIPTMTTTVQNTFHYGAWSCAAASATAAEITVPGSHTAGGTVKSAYATGSNLTIRTGWRTVVAPGASGTVVGSSDLSVTAHVRQVALWPTALPAGDGMDADQFSILDGILARTIEPAVFVGAGGTVPTTGQIWPRGVVTNS